MRIAHGVSVRIAYVTESFPPTSTASRTRPARRRAPGPPGPQPAGHRAPAGRALPCPDRSLGYPVVRVPSLPMPGYHELRVGLPGPPRMRAGPGRPRDRARAPGQPVRAGRQRRRRPPSGWACRWSPSTRPTCPATPALYRLGPAGPGRGLGTAAPDPQRGRTGRWPRPPRPRPSLHAHGVRAGLAVGRGVDTRPVRPGQAQRAAARRAGPGRRGAGRVRRQAGRRRSALSCSAEVAALPGVRLVIVGCGPAEAAARRAMPAARLPRPAQRRGAGRASTPAWTCSCTAGRTRRSARRCRRPRPAACPWSRPPRAARSTWSATASPGSWCRRASRWRWPARWPGWPPTPALRAAQGRARQWVLGRSWRALGDELIGHYEAVLGTASAVEVPA